MSATNPLYDEELRCRHCAYQGTKCKRANNITVNLVSDCAHLHRGSYQGICSDFAPNPNYPFYFKSWTSFQDYFDHAAPDIPRPNLADQTAAAVFCFNGDRSILYFVSQNDFIFGNLYQDGKLRTVYRQVKTKNIHSSSGYSYPTEACDFTPLPQGASVPLEAVCTVQPAYPPLIYTPPLTSEQDCPYPYDETFTPKVWEGNDFMPPPTVCPWGPNVHRWLSYFGEGYHHVVPKSENGSNTIANIVGLCTEHHNLVHKDATWQKKLAKEKVGLVKKYSALSVLNQIIPALTKEMNSLFPKHFFVTNGKSTYDYRTAHGVSKDHWLDAYCIACSVLPNDVCDSNINSHVPYELKQFRRHDRRVLHKANMSRVYTLNGKTVATNRHKAIKQTTDSLEEFRQSHPGDVCKLKVKEHHPAYRNLNRNYPGSVFLVDGQVHVMQGVSGSHNGKADGYYNTNGNAYPYYKCKFVVKNEGIVFA